jgi:multisubunit Na+/H+ antiporter MnhC subunit
METNVIYIIGGILAIVIFIFIAKRVLRLAIKMTLVGIVILALLAGAGYGWWNGWFDSQSKWQRRSGPVRTASPR